MATKNETVARPVRLEVNITRIFDAQKGIGI